MRRLEATVSGTYLTSNEIVEFKALVKETMAKELTYEVAEDQGTRLIKLFGLLSGSSRVPSSQKDAVDWWMNKNKNGGNTK